MLQNATITARLLGISYLPVDLVCIIQGNDADKAEIGRITSVCTHNILAMMAERGAKVTDGFLHHRALPLHMQGPAIKFKQRYKKHVDKADSFNFRSARWCREGGDHPRWVDPDVYVNLDTQESKLDWTKIVLLTLKLDKYRIADIASLWDSVIVIHGFVAIVTAD